MAPTRTSGTTVLEVRAGFSHVCTATGCRPHFDYLEEKQMPNHLTRESVTRYIHWLRTRECGITTCNLRLSALKSLLRYCAEEDISLQSVYQEVNNIPSRKVSREPVGYLSKDALAALLAQPDIATMKGRRNRMIVILLYDTGTRVQELVDLKVSDVYLQAQTPFVIVTGKGRKFRSIPLMVKTVTHLQEYLRHVPWWIGRQRRPRVVLFYARGATAQAIHRCHQRTAQELRRKRAQDMF